MSQAPLAFEDGFEEGLREVFEQAQVEKLTGLNVRRGRRMLSRRGRRGGTPEVPG